MSSLADLKKVASGKVRDIYELDGDLLLVASDRVSTYDAVHPTPIPGKGAVLTGISAFWFDETEHLVPNHVVSYSDGVPPEVRGSAVRVRKLQMLPVECVVRGHITGSGWSDYLASGGPAAPGQISGIEIPAGLQESQQFPQPLFTPSTKADEGHDMAISFEQSARLLDELAEQASCGSGDDLAEMVSYVAIQLYEFGRDHCASRGVILADTKFEFGVDPETGLLTLGDEAMTPDSSRYWPADQFKVGQSQPSFDKQYVRDWAAGSGWDKLPPAPAIPGEIVAGTQKRYEEAFSLITGRPLERWLASVQA